MSPKGGPHFCEGEHALNHHPEIGERVAKQLRSGSPFSDSNEIAEKLGYCRFGRDSLQLFVNYDQESSDGRAAAIHVISYYKPEDGFPIFVADRPHGHPEFAKSQYRFLSRREALQYIRNV
jgi:hypothetical protein